ncbi:hypothetical protein NMY22_g8158 [Coprinellus aureogranulatus]|nr:hypothetical protein NMY22_g8158 [Coprinellus aureogranulatus]
MEYDEAERRDLGSIGASSPVEPEVFQVAGTGEEMELRERTGTEGTLESVDADERVLLPKATVSVDEMLDEMISKSYELVSEEPAPPSMHGVKISSSGPVPQSDAPANVALAGTPSPVRPLHLKPKYTAQSLLDELRRESPQGDQGKTSENSNVGVKTPAIETCRTLSGTFSVNSASDLEARLMDVAMDDEEDLHVHIGSGFGRASVVRRQSTLKPFDHPTLEGGAVEGGASHKADLVDDDPTTLIPPERSNTLELEFELQRLKEQNKQAMGALEEATRQIHSLEERLASVEGYPASCHSLRQFRSYAVVAMHFCCEARQWPDASRHPFLLQTTTAFAIVSTMKNHLTRLYSSTLGSGAHTRNHEITEASSSQFASNYDSGNTLAVQEDSALHPDVDAVPTNAATKNRFKRILKGLCSSKLSPIHAVRKQGLSRTAHALPNEGEFSGGRQILQTSIVVFDVAFSVVETIPVLGGPLKGALEALCKVLRLVEQRFQNQEDIGALTERLTTLIETLCKAGTSDDVLRQLVRRLHDIERKLQCMLSKSGIRYPAIAQFLAGCNDEINSCLLDFTASRLAIPDMERLSTECVTVIDPFGFPQKMLRGDMGSNELVAQIILNRYSINPSLKRLLDGFVRGQMYELTMDDGQEIRALTGVLVSRIGQGSTVAMSVIIERRVDVDEPASCPICHGVMPTSPDARTVCNTCERRVSAIKSHMEASASSSEHAEQSTSQGLELFRQVTVLSTPAQTPQGFFTHAWDFTISGSKMSKNPTQSPEPGDLLEPWTLSGPGPYDPLPGQDRVFVSSSHAWPRLDSSPRPTVLPL